MLQDATTRFVMKFAGYVGTVNYASVPGYSQSATLAATTSAIANSALQGATYYPYVSPVSNLAITFLTDTNGVVLSMFSNTTLALELNTSTLNIDNIFKRL